MNRLKRRNNFIIITGLVLGLWLQAVVVNAGKVYININSPEMVPFPIAVADFTSPGQANKELTANIQRVVVNDLEISGFFQVIGAKDFPSDVQLKGEGLDILDLEAWAGKGVDVLLGGSFEVSGNELRGSFQLYDLLGRNPMPGLSYKAKPSEWRLIAHRIANEVVRQITGEKGVFDTKIAFVSNSSGNKEIYLIDFDGENGTQVTHNKSINILPRWYTDGRKLLYTCFRKRNPDLYAVDISSQREYPISVRNGLNASAAWSPDGKRMILMLKEDDRSHLFLMKIGEKNPVQLTSGSGNYTTPTWSPDGKQIAFVSDRVGSPQIYKMDLATKKMDRLTYEGEYNVSPSWSPKAEWIAFCSRVHGRFEIFLINPDGTQVRQLTENGTDNEEPSWSPDGRYLAFTSRRGGVSAIYVMNVNGTHHRRVTVSIGEAMNAAWSPYLE